MLVVAFSELIITSGMSLLHVSAALRHFAEARITDFQLLSVHVVVLVLTLVDCNNKLDGFVLDFVGIFGKLEKVLAFDRDEINAIMKDLGLLHLVPGLRKAKTPAQRTKVFKHEAIIVVVTAAAAGVVVWIITSSVLHWILSDRYSIAWPLSTAALVTGTRKVLSSLAASLVNALGSGRDFLLISGVGWVAIAFGFIGASVGVRWGLTGLVFGVGAGWLFDAVHDLCAAAERRIFAGCFQYLHNMERRGKQHNAIVTIARLVALACRSDTLQSVYEPAHFMSGISQRSKAVLITVSLQMTKCDRCGFFATCRTS